MHAFLVLLAFIASCTAEVPLKEYWPKKVTLLKNLKVEQKLPNGVVKREFKLGDKVDLVLVSEGNIEFRSGMFNATVPVSDTDFMELSKSIENAAIESKLKQEAEAQEKIRLELSFAEAKASQDAKAKESAGNPILKSDNDGVSLDPVIYKAIKDNLKDPDSFQSRKLISKDLVKISEDTYIWHVRLQYGAKNGFGGYSLGNATVLYRAGKASIYKLD